LQSSRTTKSGDTTGTVWTSFSGDIREEREPIRALIIFAEDNLNQIHQAAVEDPIRD